MAGVSVLIPTYNRPAKLHRLLSYLEKLKEESLLPLDIEFLIGDGSSIENKAIDHYLTRDYINSKDIDIKYFYKPELGLIQRVYFLIQNAKNSIIILNGDDDLPIFADLYKILKYFDDPKVSAVAPRFININKIFKTRLNFSVSERPYYGFSVDSVDILSRIILTLSLNSVGISSLSYSYQRKEIIQEFYKKITEGVDNLFYGGAEFIHIIDTVVSGHIIFPEYPSLFRDFTYIGYIREQMREAPESDPYPYFGKDAMEYIFKHLENKTGKTDIREIMNSLMKSFSDIQNSRLKTLQLLEKLDLPEIGSYYELAESFYLDTIHLCYPGYQPEDEYIKISKLRRFKNFVYNFIK